MLARCTALCLAVSVALHVRALLLVQRLGRAAVRTHDERGQTSAEYALVLLGAASIALLVAVWARKSNSVGKLLDAVFGQITDMMG